MVSGLPRRETLSRLRMAIFLLGGKGSLAHGRVWGKNPGRSWAGFLCCVLNN
jgi:hypothetical protein